MTGAQLVRVATAADLDRLLTMGSRFLAESPYRGRISHNTQQMSILVQWLLGQDQAQIYVLERESDLAGMIGVALFAHPISGEQTASELFWYVSPEARGGHGALKLVKAAEQWAYDHGAVRMQMIAPTERVEQLYQALGYERIEVVYQRALQPVDPALGVH